MSITQQSRGSEHQPWQCLLSAARPVSGERPGGDATSGPAASAVPLCRLGACCAQPAGRRGVQDRPPARENADGGGWGIEALYRRPRTTKPEPGHKIYPYLLRDLEIHAAQLQVWAMDIHLYIPMARGFIYLAVVLDWFARPP